MCLVVRADGAPIDLLIGAVPSRSWPAWVLVAEVADAARSNRAKRERPPAVHGRRAKGFVRLSLTVRPEMKNRLRERATLEGVTMADLLDELLDRVL